MSEIPEPKKGDIPPDETALAVAAELSQNEEPLEESLYKISFAEYKNKECQMDGMTGPNAKATLQILRDVGVYYTDEESYLSNARNIQIKAVICDGDYRDFYRGLSEDSELKEIKYQHNKKNVDIRLFFFTIESERTFYLIAARETHVDTSKGSYRIKERR